MCEKCKPEPVQRELQLHCFPEDTPLIAFSLAVYNLIY